MNPPEKKLSLALDLSRQILELARQKEWSKIQQLDRERMQLLEEIFSGDGVDTNNNATAAQLEELVRLNDEAVSLCSQAKEGVMVEGRKIRQGKEAVAAYLKNTS